MAQSGIDSDKSTAEQVVDGTLQGMGLQSTDEEDTTTSEQNTDETDESKS